MRNAATKRSGADDVRMTATASEEDVKLMRADNLTTSEVQRARQRHLFTVTAETGYGYYVTLFQFKGIHLRQISQSKECRRPSTARSYGARLVRNALKSSRIR